MENLENIRVIIEDGRVVSHLAIWEGELIIYGCMFKVGMIGCVCTHPDYRNRGYASALVRDAIEKLRREEVSILMISGIRGLYRRAGCIPAGTLYEFIITKKSLDWIKNLKFDVLPITENLLPEVIRIYQREPVRYRRSLEEFKTLLIDRILDESVPLTAYMTLMNGKPIAYIATSALSNRPGEIWEYAGSRYAVLGAIFRLMEECGSELSRIQIPFHDYEMLSIMEMAGLKPSRVKSPASISIPNPNAFMESFRPYLEERVGEKSVQSLELMAEGSGFRLRVCGSEFNLRGITDMVRLFFGEPEINPQSDERGFLAHALPIPTPIYGLNYL